MSAQSASRLDWATRRVVFTRFCTLLLFVRSGDIHDLHGHTLTSLLKIQAHKGAHHVDVAKGTGHGESLVIEQVLEEPMRPRDPERQKDEQLSEDQQGEQVGDQAPSQIGLSSSLVERSIILQVQGKADQAQTQSQFLLETILHELQELRDIQSNETTVNNQSLDKTEKTMGQTPVRLKDLEQRVSDLEDGFLGWDKELNSVQKTQRELQKKTELMENHVSRSNISFVGVPERANTRI
ncbi:hypothetical protein NDU88_001876 [Pleurodeles waltl]|uniref:Uncharacterized protein n=1 Tax=Pleurodeles waltl TaxID=8319 RepID=A0AAV7VD17_PLEWA|nr:hypothetical protein NDU88_001876 [Pleurodeles waltl]